ncbi:membrane fusion protein (multidrug efflux system) [Rhizomicrobium palustre]|uniref:Membrane fusion protein (Multidrug efflux system) n=1 Tax=Rhizomicrobium palustre TaxID=189966 RepID=A0A846N1C2_9PROT|nr:HlyD family secretion protein [Rhizomicrobium palustre]NIK89764.1 membrane fusion protein (multidrug efflux system) [Rhizomicrobium palustre]
MSTGTYYEGSNVKRSNSWLGGLIEDKARLRRVLMIGGVSLVAVVALTAWLTSGRYVGTDDSYVRAAKLMVTTDVSGLVKTVDVRAGQHVKKGQVLFTLDPHPFEIAVANSKAALEEARLGVLSSEAAYKALVAEVAAQQAQVRLAQTTYTRYAALAKSNAIAPQTLDQARSTLASAQATLAASQQNARTQLDKLLGNPDLPPEKAPAYLQAQAAYDEAVRQLNHATVRAPFDGDVTEVDSLQPGTLLISAMSSFSTTSAVGLVSTTDLWVEANMKETDLTHVRVGAPVDVTIDTYPGKTWSCHVGAIARATSGAFSALPSENASSNWVKVVQRIPVRIACDVKPSDPQLRAGMSAIVSIDTGERRWSRMFSNR